VPAHQPPRRVTEYPSTQVTDPQVNNAAALMMQPFQAQRELMTTIAGIGPFADAAVISEAGADIAETFPSAAHFASWIGACPGNHESAGKRHSGKPRKGTSICSTSSSNAPGPRHALRGYLLGLTPFGGHTVRRLVPSE
jgi:transposase